MISFLNAVLELEDSEKLYDIEILDNTKLKRDGPADKLGILDIRAKTLAGEQINIEVQLVNQYNMDKRTLFYWSKMYSEQLKEGQPFDDLKKTITINILDFNYMDVDSYNTVFHLWEDRHKGYKLTDVLEIRFIELPKFRKAKFDLSRPLDRWLVFIDDLPEEVLKMAMKAEPVIAKAEELLEYLGSLDEVKRYYEAREREVHDEVTRTNGAKEEGRKEGRKEGQQEKQLEIAKKMLYRGLPIEQIIECTGLSINEIEKLN